MDSDSQRPLIFLTLYDSLAEMVLPCMGRWRKRGCLTSGGRGVCDSVGLTRCEAPEAAWAGRLTHRPGPPRGQRGWLVLARDYRTGEKAAGISSLLSCRIGRTPAWGGHAPPLLRASSRTRARSFRSL